jgi:hypothetical protein
MNQISRPAFFLMTVLCVLGAAVGGVACDSGEPDTATDGGGAISDAGTELDNGLTCEGENPEGCSEGNCDHGFECAASDDCLSGSCDCDPETGEWICEENCLGGECVPLPTGHITGRIVNADGMGIGAAKIICCTATVCINVDTDADGYYLVSDILIEPRKMQVLDTTNTYMSILFYQEVVADSTSSLGRDVILPTTTETAASWTEDEGGSVSLAGGKLELTAASGVLDYPLGTAVEEVLAQELEVSDLPPYDEEPWAGVESMSYAFLFDPVHIVSEEAVELKITATETLVPGEQYQIWSVEPDTATLIDCGTATVDSNGHIVSDSSSDLKHLSIIIVIPVSS